MDSDRFVNKRAEMTYMVKEWIEDNGVNIPDEDSLHAELMCMPHDERTANNKIFFIPKVRIKKEYGMSPDIFDGIALTFSYPVRRKLPGGVQRFKKAIRSQGGKSPLKTMNEHRRPKSKNSTSIIRFGSKV